MNLTTYLNSVGNTINGSLLRKTDLALVAKLDAMGAAGVLDSSPCVIRNPVTGFQSPLNPFVAALVKWTYVVYASYDPMSGRPMNYYGTKVAVGTYDRIRYLVLAIDKNAYRDFLD